MKDNIIRHIQPTTVYPVCGDLIVVLDRNRNTLQTVIFQHASQEVTYH